MGDVVRGEVPLARQPFGQLRPGLFRCPGIVNLVLGPWAGTSRLMTIPSGVLAIVAGKKQRYGDRARAFKSDRTIFARHLGDLGRQERG